MKNQIVDIGEKHVANVQPIEDAATGNALNVKMVTEGGGIGGDNPLEVQIRNYSIEDAGNSTTVPILALATWEGTPRNVSEFASIGIFISADQASEPHGFKIWFSPNGVDDWEIAEEYTVLAGAKKFFTPTMQGLWYKLTYQNDGLDQTQFHVHTVLRTSPIKFSSHNIEQAIAGEDDAELVKAVLTGLAPDGEYKNVLVTNQGNQKVSIEEFESGVSVNSNTQLKTTPFLSNGKEGIAYADSPSIDAFSRLRVSSIATVYDSMLQYDLDLIQNLIQTVGTGSVTHLPLEAAAQLSTGGTASGAKAIYQSRKYVRYQAGKSQMALLTGVIGEKKTNVRKRIGLFDDDNGIFFEQDGAGQNAVVIRSKTTGSVVDNKVVQANWNIDPFDGTGPSGLTLDDTKSQIFVIDFQWLGVGRVRMGLDINGLLHYVHEFNHANWTSVVYMATPHLPIRIEIENVGTAASATTLKKICSAVVAEGGLRETPGYAWTASRGTTALGVTSRRPVLSIRLNPNFLSQVNRGHVIFKEMELLAASNNCHWEMTVAGILTGASWVDVDTNNSIAQYDVSATAISGERIFDQGFALSGGGVAKGQASGGDVPVEVYNSYDGTTPTIISLVCTSFTGTTNVNPILRWNEQR